MRTIGDILKDHRRQLHYSQADVAKLLTGMGISTARPTVSTWENGYSLPPADTLMALCRILDISDLYADYFGSNPHLLYSLLNEDGRQLADSYIRLLLTQKEYRKAERIDSEAPVVPFEKVSVRYFDLPASAGFGEFLDSDHFEMLEVGGPIPEGTDFAIRIHGDSMTPNFLDGQLVWVHQQDELSSGEIGIFYLNGDAYIKKLLQSPDGTFLVSLNEQYQPITIQKTDSFKIFGKVLV